MPIGTIHVFELARQNVVDEGFAKLAKLDPEGPDRADWMKEAVGLIDVFRETRELFSGNRVREFSFSATQLLTSEPTTLAQVVRSIPGLYQ